MFAEAFGKRSCGNRGKRRHPAAAFSAVPTTCPAVAEGSEGAPKVAARGEVKIEAAIAGWNRRTVLPISRSL